MALEEIRSERIKKIQEMRVMGKDPYPASVNVTHSVDDVVARFSTLLKAKKLIAIAGRVMAKREHGGSAFFDVQGQNEKLQIYFKRDELGEEFALAGRLIDIGDFLEVLGTLFKTKRGEESLEVKEWRIISKSLRPLPEKWHGLTDAEERFRKRYLDLVMNKEVRSRFLLRSRIIQVIRSVLGEEGFLEVETPMLHALPGGALAKPFSTHHNALDIDLYLRIAPELFLKRLLVGGFEKVYEIGKNFRNEGIDVTHNPEFTMLECYAAYWDEEKMMKFVENLFIRLFKEVGMKDIKKPFSRISFKDVLARYALITNYDQETRESFVVRARQLGVDASPSDTKEKLADEIYKKICRPYITQPTFIVHHPIEISPLAKKREEKPNEVRRFQLVMSDLEMVNGFSELNDPLDQRERFEAQEKIGGQGEDEAHRTDEDYLEAMEYGMPPAAGIGIGIDRLMMLLSDTKNIREVVLFPTMKPKA